MPKILSVKQLYEADKTTVEKQKISFIDLMEHVGTLCFQWIHARLQGSQVNIQVFCGTGNNGGDGLVIARHLKQHGYNVKTHIVNCGNERSEVFLKNYDRLKEIGVWAEMITCESELPQITENDMIVDAIFGLGLSRKPEDLIKEVIQHINASNAYVLSIDFPSGLYAERSVTDKEAVVRAYHTLTFQTPKLAFLLPENKDYSKTWDVLDIGLDAEYIYNAKTDNYFLVKEDIKPIYRFREKFSHKGDFGHSLIMGGSFGKIGAVSLSAKATLVIGSGLVTAYIPKCGYQVLQTSIPEVMVETDAENELQNFKSEVEATVIGIGMGMGTKPETAKGLGKFLKINKIPLVLDADAINLLSKNKELLKSLPENSVLTPHPKEFERLAGKWKDDYDKLKKLRTLSKKHKIIIVLKGAFTVIAHDGELYFNSTGNPALATAGSGDVLTGIITGLIAQKYHPFEAALLGVYLHGKTADLTMQTNVYETFVASDIIASLPHAFMDLLKKEPPIVQPKEEESAKNKESKDDDRKEMYI
ncbi:NAD(P)H-hydrate dehydratase [Aureibaculum sp. 2210JD6-5]|uniref:NAD(P)H-hydrate dehydratase n=1 Tax=Aureibaculum sp. 2210JD6-5 TaxID=3103957 RepID=UPI002AACBE37|nr:NAD(P)H-hydrate dehydratase [Aureibaculum sp. 2210JD6-5]MDY7394319.1 NAD(P)H-hydrate dehydratase [Aureibaculum sp. 2210JD6-5]